MGNFVENIEKIKITSMHKLKDDVIVTWAKPTVTKDVQEYECVVYGFQEYSIQHDLNSADFPIHSFTSSTSHTFKDLNSEWVYIISKVISILYMNNK